MADASTWLEPSSPKSMASHHSFNLDLRRREYPEAPIVGVGAVIIHENQVLLIQRGQEPLKGEWSLPGGALELGETLQQGIRREVLEETGLEVEPLQIVE